MATPIVPTQLSVRIRWTREADVQREAAHEMAAHALSRGLVSWLAPPDALEIPVAAGDDGTRYQLMLNRSGSEVDVRLIVDRRPWTCQGESLSMAQVVAWYRDRSPDAKVEDLPVRHTALLVPAARRGRARVPIGGVDLGDAVAVTPDRHAPQGAYRWYSLERATRVWRVADNGAVDLFVLGPTDDCPTEGWSHWTLGKPGRGSPLRRVHLSLERSRWRNLAFVNPAERARLPERWIDPARSHVGQGIPLRALELLLPWCTPDEFVAALRERIFGPGAARVATGDRITVAGIEVSVVSAGDGVAIELFDGRLRGTIDAQGVCAFMLTK